jgi:hypothetical protein
VARDDAWLRQLILSILNAEPEGLEVAQVVERLKTNDGRLSPRLVRNTLNDMADSDEVVRQRRITSVRGAPKLVYYHPRNAVAQTLLPGLIPGLEDLQLFERGQIEQQDLETEERDRQARSSSFFHRLAERHLNEEQLAQAIIGVARRLAREEPISLILEMAQWVVNDLNTLGAELRLARPHDVRHAEKLASELDVRLHWARWVFWGLFRLDRPVAQSPGILELPRSPRGFAEGEVASLSVARARERLEERVVGTRVLEAVELGDCPHTAVAGSDSSVADIYLEHVRGSFVPPDPVSVMTAAAALQVRGRNDRPFEYQEFDVFPDQLREYGDTQAAVNGLVLSPILRSVLPEQDFEHSRMAAMDLRQYLEDLRVILKEARWRPMGEAPLLDVMPRPTAMIRDGRLFPLVHRLQDYESDGLYGQIVRRELERFTQALFNLLDGPTGRTVYAAVVKSPELSWFSPLVMWYLRSRNIRLGGRILSSDEIYRPPLADTAVSHLLFLGLAKTSNLQLERFAFRTFIWVRRFSDIAIGKDGSLPVIESEQRLVDENERDDWLSWLMERRHARGREYRVGRDSSTGLELDEYAPFVYACCRAAVAMGYMAHAGTYRPLVRDDQGAHFLLPRFEFAVDAGSLRRKAARQLLEEDIRGLLSWTAANGMELDRGHTQTDFDTHRNGRLPVLVPSVIVSAHEAAMFTRNVLGDEFTDALRSLIAELRRRQSQRAMA